MIRTLQQAALAALVSGWWLGAALAQDVARPPEVIPSNYDRYGTGFRDSFEHQKSRGYDTFLAELSAAHPSPRAHAATMLGVLGQARAVPVLEKFLKVEKDETTRHGAYVGLILLGDRRHVRELRQALRRDLAEYPDWVKSGIPGNSLASAARSFRVLAEYEIALSPAVIDELFRRLDHVDSGVRIDAAVALQNSTAIGFGFRGDVSNPGEYAPMAEAWRAWWKDNRARYERKQHYVVNGLELVVAPDGDRLRATFHNHGPAPLRLPAPSPNPVKEGRGAACGATDPTLTLRNARGGVVQSLRSDTGPCSAYLADPPADVLHWESVELAPGAAYSFRLPAVTAAEPFTLAYLTRACGPGRWCGELRSNVLNKSSN